jgi:hypothetical protein
MQHRSVAGAINAFRKHLFRRRNLMVEHGYTARDAGQCAGYHRAPEESETRGKFYQPIIDRQFANPTARIKPLDQAK